MIISILQIRKLNYDLGFLYDTLSTSGKHAFRYIQNKGAYQCQDF